eukprot:TRINITY_DN23152_c0_g1_i1.p1 TRINITY_DN23152_c0_g1~~TRINITY_DN23152_c0_g1_i1.p1  ORF type:complete len:385 (+),score=112.69 TRINITY_DN23152_c0_g1_i1:139-1155(+)
MCIRDRYGEPIASNMQTMNQTMQQQSDRLQKWKSRICTVQSANCTEDQRVALRNRFEKQSRAQKRVETCRRLQKCSAVNQRSWNRAMTDYRDAAMAPMAKRAQKFKEAKGMAMESMMQAQQVMSTAADCQEEDLCQLDQLQEALQLSDTTAELAVEVEADISEMEQLLQQLRAEPSMDAEVQAKFDLYEKYLETVTLSRGSLFEFWHGCSEEFNEAGQQAVEASIQRIDNQDAMSVHFAPGRWFVYDMTKKAGENNGVINAVLRGIQTKLELMGEQTECPVCLEEFSPDVCSQTLGCCHKVCKECWECWQEMNQGHGFCPLCRHEEFVGNFVCLDEQR